MSERNCDFIWIILSTLSSLMVGGGCLTSLQSSHWYETVNKTGSTGEDLRLPCGVRTSISADAVYEHISSRVDATCCCSATYLALATEGS